MSGLKLNARKDEQRVTGHPVSEVAVLCALPSKIRFLQAARRTFGRPSFPAVRACFWQSLCLRTEKGKRSDLATLTNRLRPHGR